MQSTRQRLTFCAFITLLPMAPIALRLAHLQVVQHKTLASKAVGETDRQTREIVPRGRILDRSGKILTESLPTWSCFMDPSIFDRSRAKRLSSAIEIPVAEITKKAKTKGKFVWLKRKLDPKEMQTVKALKIPGVGLIEDEQRFYPDEHMARPLLGALNLEGRGVSGLEQTHEKDLMGKPRTLKMVRDGSGKSVYVRGEDTAPPPDLTLTIDRSIQHYAEMVLSEGMAKHKALKGVIIVQEPKTGDILAMASRPDDPLKNPAIQDAFEPGSTFKIVTMLGVLEEKAAKLDEVINVENGKWALTPSVTIKDHEPHAELSLTGVMEQSSNIGMAKIGLRLGAEKLYRYCRAFGFGSRTGIALPGETAGLLKRADAMSKVTVANVSFGQGLGATPLQIVSAFSAIANGGTLYEPRLVAALGKSKTRSAAVIRRVGSPESVAALHAMLKEVVAKGTGMNAAVSGFPAAGKTGTAQKIDPATGRYSARDYVASFVGYAPADDPSYTILVMIDSPKNQYYGSDVAAPMFRQLMQHLLALRGQAPAFARAAARP